MLKKKTYTRKLNKNQMNTIYSISYNKDKQNRLMSILQYCIKYTDHSTGLLTKTIGRLFTMYSAKDFKYHDRISRKYFYTLVKHLIDCNLICVHKKVHKTVHKTNAAESIDITTVESTFEKTNNKYINNTYTYTPYTTTNVVKLKTEKVKALDLVDEVFRDLKVKSKIIKSMVISKLQNIKLDLSGAIKYIIKVVTEKTEQYNNMRVKYAQQVAKTKYSKSKNTYSAPVTRTLNNFKAREYDYDMLEDKLIYGGYNGEELPL